MQSIIKCPYCNKQFDQKYDLGKHLFLEHNCQIRRIRHVLRFWNQPEVLIHYSESRPMDRLKPIESLKKILDKR